ncbi:Uncharacterized WD repeat-containing protein all2124 [Durusdinium trenchii]
MLLELLGHRTAVLTVDLNGDTVLSGDKDEAILWSLEGSLLRRWGGFEGGLNVVLFVGPDEAALAVHHEVQVISTSSSTSFKTVRLPHDVRVAALAARNFPGSAGDLLLACGCVDAHATLWRLAKGKSRKGTGIEFSPSFLLRFPAGDQDVRAISLSASGDLLAAGNDDTRMRLWKIQPKKAEISIEPLCTAGLHTDWIHSVSTADGSLVASGADDNSIALYDVQAQRLVGRVRIFSGAFCVVLSPNGHWLFSASGDIRVWSVPKMIQETHKSRTAFRRHVVPISALAMRRDGREALAVSGDVDETGTPNGGLQLSRWDCATASQLSFCIIPGSKEDDDRPLCLSLSPNGSACAVGCDTGKLWVLALDGTAVWETEAHSERIHCCEWLEDDSIATGSEDGSVCCWSLELRACRAQCRPYEGNGPVRCFAWTHDRERVLCGGDYQHPRLVHLAGPGEDGYMAMEYQDVLRQGKKLACHPPCPKTALVSICGEIVLGVDGQHLLQPCPQLGRPTSGHLQLGQGLASLRRGHWTAAAGGHPGLRLGRQGLRCNFGRQEWASGVSAMPGINSCSSGIWGSVPVGLDAVWWRPKMHLRGCVPASAMPL